MGLLYRVAVFAVIFVGAALMRRYWKRQALLRLAAIDRGVICSTCSSTAMRVDNDVAHCDSCGEERDLAAMRQHRISKSDLDAMMKPQERDTWQ